MRVVLTLLVRDEADVVGPQLEYHLNAGVDFVIATDHESVDGTTEILESYAKQGVLRRIAVTGAIDESPWRTRMARLAATEHGADWVINTDADEFWMPRRGTLRDVLSAVPGQYGIVWALSRQFVPRPGGGAFGERMTVRVSSPVPINDPMSPYRPHAKVAHRGDAGIVVRHGSHLAHSPRLAPLRGWYPADCLHFPFRSLDQYVRKCTRRASKLGQYARGSLASEVGKAERVFSELVVDGSLVIDTRLRDALRDGGSPAARTSADEDALAEAAALHEADVVRLRRNVDELGVRLDLVTNRRGAFR